MGQVRATDPVRDPFRRGRSAWQVGMAGVPLCGSNLELSFVAGCWHWRWFAPMPLNGLALSGRHQPSVSHLWRRVICLTAQEPTWLQSRFCNDAITVNSSEGRGAGLLRVGYNLDDSGSDANLGRSCRSETLARPTTFARCSCVSGFEAKCYV